jgi:hypothetical protein
MNEFTTRSCREIIQTGSRDPIYFALLVNNTRSLTSGEGTSILYHSHYIVFKIRVSDILPSTSIKWSSPAYSLKLYGHFSPAPSVLCTHGHVCITMPRLTTEIRYEKRVVRRFRRCSNVIWCTYTNLDSIAYYTTRLYPIAPRPQTCTACYCTEYCRQL